MNFFERALNTVQKGIPVIRLLPKTKIPMDNNWPALATTNPETLQRWNQESPRRQLWRGRQGFARRILDSRSRCAGRLEAYQDRNRSGNPFHL